jgi:hypothetical protein
MAQVDRWQFGMSEWFRTHVRNQDCPSDIGNSAHVVRSDANASCEAKCNTVELAANSLSVPI